MTIRTRKVNNTTILDLAGDLTMGKSAEGLCTEIHHLLNGGARHFAINLAEVNYIDSCGLGALVSSFASAQKAQVKCVFFGAPSSVSSILKMAHLDAIFSLFPDEASALSSLSAPGSPGAAA